MKRLLIPGLLVVSFVLPAFLMGCATSVTKRTAEMSKQMDAQSTTVGDLQRRVDSMNTVLVNLQAANQADVKPLVAEYTGELKRVKKAGDKSRSKYADMLDARQAYIADFQTENKKLTNPTLRQAANTRYHQTMASYDRLSDRSNNMQAAYNTYVNDLDQINNFLATDQTKEGVARINPVIQKARTDGDAMKVSAAEYQTALNQTAVSITR